MIPSTRISWKKYFTKVSEIVALRSPDLHKQVGAVVVNSKNRVLSTGYNGLPRDVDESLVNWDDREAVRELIIHAECNAILFLRKEDMNEDELTLYCSLSPCPECVKLVKTAGISKIFFIEKYRKYEESKRICDIFGIHIEQV
jgi:dCMP deaminase